MSGDATTGNTGVDWTLIVWTITRGGDPLLLILLGVAAYAFFLWRAERRESDRLRHRVEERADRLEKIIIDRTGGEPD